MRKAKTIIRRKENAHPLKPLRRLSDDIASLRPETFGAKDVDPRAVLGLDGVDQQAQNEAMGAMAAAFEKLPPDLQKRLVAEARYRGDKPVEWAVAMARRACVERGAAGK